MTEIKVLFLGGGKRVSLARQFLNASENLGISCKLYSYELDLFQPIAQLAEVIAGVKWSDNRVKSDILEIVVSKHIDLVIANVDPATKILSELKLSHPAASFCSNIDTVNACFSKKMLTEMCVDRSIAIIPSVHDSLDFPCFVKPDFGSASEGARIIYSDVELESALINDPTLIIQKYIKGTEYTVDCYVEQSGKILGISPRIRLATAGGEVTESQTVDDKRIVFLSEDIIAKLDLTGPITLQFIESTETQELFLMEINARFGGGVVLSIESGFDFPSMMIKELLQLINSRAYFKKSMVMRRYFSEVFE
ncbi:ATP-grasp domain-containing protein [Gammaproteobacteria bacterium]|nr:ATP-grasp domain-containing protein [Gammaproteobacteria bacterium]